jgi:ketosteroid isomerase-like protein
MNSTEKFLRLVNDAFSKGDTQFLLKHVTEDFSWIIVGEKTVGGPTELTEALDGMKNMPPMKIDIHHVMTTGNSGVVEGVVVGRNRNDQKKYFGFCDIYKLAGEEELKIKRMTSYVIDVSKHKQYKESF